MEKDQEIIESLITGGIVGAALGALVSGKNGAALGALAGAAILASFKANEQAQKTGIPLIVEEGNALYQINPDGTKIFLKNLPQNMALIPEKFTLL